MANFTKGKTFASTEQVTSSKLHQLIEDAEVAIGAFNKIWPVGSVYTSVLSTNPNTLFGFGTWTAFGAGRTLVGLDAGQTEFDTVEETGGAKTHTLTETELAAHTHSISASGTTSSSGAHTHTQNGSAINPSGVSLFAGVAGAGNVNLGDSALTSSDGSHTHTVTVTGTSGSAGSGTAHNNLQPYIVVYFWKRTA